MLARDIEMFIEHCGLKGLSTKTINSYEQTLRLFMQYMDEQGILLTEKITHLAIQGYIKSIKERGKYTVTTNPNSGNYPDRRVDFGKRVSDVTINNYLRNLRVFFNAETFDPNTYVFLIVKSHSSMQDISAMLKNAQEIQILLLRLAIKLVKISKEVE